MDINTSKTIKILIVDDDRRMAKTLVDILTVKGFYAVAAYDGNEAIEQVENINFNCVLTDIRMPKINGIELFKKIKSIDPSIPVILMTAYATHGLVDEGIKEGAIGVLTKPLDINLLLSFFASIEKEHAIVIIDDDPEFNKTMGDILSSRGYDIKNVTSPDLLSNDFLINTSLVLLDLKLSDADSIKILKFIKRKYPDLPVIIITGYKNEMVEAINTALSLGAYTCLYKPLEINKLIQQINEINKTQLKQLLNTSH